MTLLKFTLDDDDRKFLWERTEMLKIGHRINATTAPLAVKRIQSETPDAKTDYVTVLHKSACVALEALSRLQVCLIGTVDSTGRSITEATGFADNAQAGRDLDLYLQTPLGPKLRPMQWQAAAVETKLRTQAAALAIPLGRANVADHLLAASRWKKLTPRTLGL